MPTTPIGTTNSFSIVYVLPPFDHVNEAPPNESTTSSSESSEIIESSENQLSFDPNPLTAEEFFNLTVKDRLVYQNYYNKLMERSTEELNIQALKEKNENLKSVHREEKFNWINHVTRHCMDTCVGERTTDHLWGELISKEYNPFKTEQKDSYSMRTWTWDRFLRNTKALLKFQKDEVSFINEAPSSYEVYDRIYYEEEQCIKKCIKRMEKTNNELSEEWKKYGGWEKMHYKTLTEKSSIQKPNPLFSKLGTPNSFLSNLIPDKPESA